MSRNQDIDEFDAPGSERRSRAVRAVASAAADARECAELLEMLGLSAREGVSGAGDRRGSAAA